MVLAIPALNSKYLRTFVTVARHLSFRRAAEELGRSQATISAQIKELEEQIGVRLIDRTTRRASLTEAGELLAKGVEVGLNIIDESVTKARSLGDGRRGRIVLACVPSLSSVRFPAILASFRAISPQSRVEIAELTSAEILLAVAQDRVDFGIGPCVDPPPPEISFAPAICEPLCVVLPASHPLGESTLVSFEMLATVPLITLSGSVLLQTQLELAANTMDVRLSSQTEVRQVQTAVAMVRAGVGVAVVPRLALPDYLDPGIVARPIGDP